MAIIDEVPKSRITIKYETDINGEKVQREIPLRLLVMGNLSAGTSKDSKLDLNERRVRELDGKNLDATMKDMDTRLCFSVSNKINPDKDPSLDVEIPIDSMKSFNPATIAERVPQLKSLLILKQLINELETTVDNNKKFRQHLGEILADPEKLTAIKDQLPNLTNYTLPDPNQLPAAAAVEESEQDK
ncbi:type VI secretion system contractile sheath small subunit [Lentisphaerota bacterium ZTH]|nr:type VI secretion system contractile sheath small subunit [Lentisphaerota bacterium]WET05678.1 type VI secretion system contractile sheath small subunit [Lentisphaerota bacterium ZTH]